MKKLFFALVPLVFFAVSCSQSMKTKALPNTSVKVTMYEKDRISSDDYGTELILGGGKNKVRVILDLIEESKFPSDLNFLIESVKEEFELIDKYELKNGAFGVSFLTKEDEEEKKNYLFYYKKDKEFLKLYNNDYYNTKMEHFDYVKSVIESMQ